MIGSNGDDSKEQTIGAVIGQSRILNAPADAWFLILGQSPMSETAVAFILFNRPFSTLRSFTRIKAAKPRKLFLIADAARPDRDGEASLVEQSRQIAEAVDWPCDVRKIYADENMGCARRISSGITAAFEEVDRLIVLEDDCVADLSFFGYCNELLTRYETDRRVMAVTGTNYQKGISRTASSYYYSKYPHCWGWATWKRAWQHFQLDIPTWPQFRDAGHLASICSSSIEIEYWTKVFNRAHNRELDSWAFPWTFCCWAQHGLATIPAVNLVSNIGFGGDATHTQRDNSNVADLPADSLGKIVHPEVMVRHLEADAYTDDLLFSQPTRNNRLLKRLKRKFRRAA